jgi:hypothetical protein
MPRSIVGGTVRAFYGDWAGNVLLLQDGTILLLENSTTPESGITL